MPLIVAVRSSATYLIVSLYLLVFGPIGMIVALVFRWPGILYILGHGGVRIGFALAGIRFSVLGREHLRPDRAVVFCANHQSNLDPPVLFEVLHPRLHVLYKAELGRLPILGRVFRIGGFIPVERGHDRARDAIEAAGRSLQAGHSFLVFPEGTRSRTDMLLPLPFTRVYLASAEPIHVPSDLSREQLVDDTARDQQAMDALAARLQDWIAGRSSGIAWPQTPAARAA